MLQYSEKQFFNPTVKEEIIYKLKIDNLTENEINERLYEVINLLDIPPNLLKLSPFELSGGEQKLISLAIILISKPKILILDEPTVGMDCDFKEKFFQILKKLISKDIIIIQVSHSYDDIFKYGDIVIRMENGKILKFGSPFDILESNSFKIILNTFKELPDISSIKNTKDLLEKLGVSYENKI